MAPPLLLLLAAVADARGRTKAPPPPAPPDDLALPYPVTAPQLVGPTAVLSLDGLDRDRFTFGMEVDLSPLRAPAPATVDAVFARLAADPRWRVGRDADGRVAVLREGTTPTIGPDGWSIHAEGCFRVALHEGVGADDRWSQGERVARVPASDDGFSVDGFRPDGGTCGPLATAVRVDGGLSIEVFESGSTTDRPVTETALVGLTALVRNLEAAGAAAAALGIEGWELPPGEPREGVGADLVLAAAGPGVLQVSGRVDPGEPGLLWVRLVDGQGVAWEEKAVAAGTLEEPGWSTREWVGFFYGSQFPVPPGPEFTATAELWFHGASGTTRRLLAVPVTVPSR